MFINWIRNIRVDIALTFRGPIFREALGFKFLNNPAAGTQMELGQFEPAETRWFETQAAKHDVLLNIGANTGYYALKAASIGARVIAIEPDTNNVKFLLRNFDANNFQDFEIYSVAISDINGAVSLYGASTGASLVEDWAGQKGRQLVPAVTLDTLVGCRLEGKKVLVVCDVEGAELAVLRGGRGLFSSLTDLTLLLELQALSNHHPTGRNPKYLETLAMLEEFGMTPSELDTSGRERPISYDSLRRSAQQEAQDFGYNYVFRKSS